MRAYSWNLSWPISIWAGYSSLFPTSWEFALLCSLYPFVVPFLVLAGAWEKFWNRVWKHLHSHFPSKFGRHCLVASSTAVERLMPIWSPVFLCDLISLEGFRVFSLSLIFWNFIVIFFCGLVVFFFLSQQLNMTLANSCSSFLWNVVNYFFENDHFHISCLLCCWASVALSRLTICYGPFLPQPPPLCLLVLFVLLCVCFCLFEKPSSTIFSNCSVEFISIICLVSKSSSLFSEWSHPLLKIVFCTLFHECSLTSLQLSSLPCLVSGSAWVPCQVKACA